MLTTDQVASLLALRHESRSVEFKSAGPFSDKRLRSRVIRAILGMANLRDGGVILLGVSKTGELTSSGSVDLTEWANHDALAGAVSAYADPFVDVEVAVSMPFDDGSNIVVIDVKQFTEVPVVCRATLLDPDDSRKVLLRKGRCYVRTHAPVQTVEVPDSTYMRELLDLAVEQRLRRHLETTRKAGGIITIGAEDPYATQREEFGRE